MKAISKHKHEKYTQSMYNISIHLNWQWVKLNAVMHITTNIELHSLGDQNEHNKHNGQSGYINCVN